MLLNYLYFLEPLRKKDKQNEEVQSEFFRQKHLSTEICDQLAMNHSNSVDGCLEVKYSDEKKLAELIAGEIFGI